MGGLDVCDDAHRLSVMKKGIAEECDVRTLAILYGSLS
jgi:hypothetical protein